MRRISTPGGEVRISLKACHREVEAARNNRLNARVLVPLTRGHGEGAALQFEVELTNLDQLDQFRNRGVGSSQETGDWMRMGDTPLHIGSDHQAVPPPWSTQPSADRCIHPRSFLWRGQRLAWLVLAL
jgi:hypothetical protein